MSQCESLEMGSRCPDVLLDSGVRCRGDRPPPLSLASSSSLAPLSTPLMRVAFDRNRLAALAVTEEDLRAMTAEERNERVFQYLTPEEIWNVSDSLLHRTRSQRSRPPGLAPLHVASVTGSVDEQQRRDAFDEHRVNRRVVLAFTLEQLAVMPLAQIEAFYPFLTADEILEINERLRQFHPIDGLVYPLSSSSTSFLRSLHPCFSLHVSPSGLVFSDGHDQTGLELHDLLLASDDEQLARLTDQQLSTVRPFLSAVEWMRLLARRNALHTGQ